MPELVNYTPYPNFRYYSRNNQDLEFGIVIVKATYEIGPTGRLIVAEEQAPLIFTDRCHGAVNVTSLWHPSDMVPNKPATDVNLNAVARTPDGRSRPSWLCSVRIENEGALRLEKTLRATGPRHWQPVWKRHLREAERAEWRKHRRAFDRWTLSEPEPIAELPLHYEYAYGGEVSQGRDENDKPLFDTDHRNPLGRGKVDAEWTDHTMSVPAPQIEDPDDPVTDPYAQMKPEAFAPIPPAWLPRRPLGGTYGQNWKDNIWPAWPSDYDFAYHNSAHPDLILTPYLTGSETIRLTGLASWAETVSIDLPGEALFCDFITVNEDVKRKTMNLDTVFLDIAASDRQDWRVFLTWRVNFKPQAYEHAVIRLGSPSDGMIHPAVNEEISV